MLAVNVSPQRSLADSNLVDGRLAVTSTRLPAAFRAAFARVVPRNCDPIFCDPQHTEDGARNYDY